MKISKSLRWQFLLYNSLFWLFIIVINFSASYTDSLREARSFEWQRTLWVLVLAYGPWLLVSPMQYVFLNRAVATGQNAKVLRQYLFQLCILLPLYIAYDSQVMMWNLGLSDKSIVEGMLLYPKFYWFFDSLLFSGVFGGYLALIYYRQGQSKTLEALQLSHQNTQLELHLAELKMQALQAQLEPHFLFNALNSISSLVRIADKKQALEAIRQLSDLLRFAVSASPRKLVTLNEELQFTQDYIDLQRLRFAERLVVKIDNQCSQQRFQIPPYVVQTLVENAIVHNLERTGESLYIEVKATMSNDSLSIEVSNNRHSNAPQHQGLGVGLENLADRLTILYQHNYGLTLNDSDDCFRVSLTLPS